MLFASVEARHGSRACRRVCQKHDDKIKSHLGQASHVQVEADDENVPGYPQRHPHSVLGGDTDKLAPWKLVDVREGDVTAADSTNEHVAQA